MNINIVPTPSNKGLRADCQFNNERKRWVIPETVYSHLKEKDRAEACIKWAQRKVVEYLKEPVLTEPTIEPSAKAAEPEIVKDKFPMFLDMIQEQGTRDRYDTDFQCYLNRLIGDLTVKQAASEATIDRVKAELLKQPSRRSKQARYLSPSTVNGALNSLRAFFHWAKRQGLIDTKPDIERVKQYRATKLSKEKRYSESQQELILDLAYKKSPTIYAAFLCGLDLGLRIGETAALKWEDIDFDRSEVSVSRTLKVSKRDKITIEVLPKNKTPDVVFMSERMSAALQAIKPAGAIGRIFQRVRFSHRSKFQAGPVSVNVLGNWVEMILTQAQKVDPEIRVSRNYHTWRHSCGTNLADKKVYVTGIQSHLRHKAISSTMHYLHPEHRDEISAALESIGSGSAKQVAKLRIIKA